MDNSQLVVFALGEEEYAIDIFSTQEIMRIPPLTRIPNSPVFLEGVFNLRGNLIPVYDLKKRFNLPQKVRGSDSRLLILDIDGTKAGIIIDDVSEVIRIDKQYIKNLGDDIMRMSKNSIEGVYIVEERIIIVLNALNLKSDILKYSFEKESVL